MQGILFLAAWLTISAPAFGQSAGRVFAGPERAVERLAVVLSNFSGDSLYADFGLETGDLTAMKTGDGDQDAPIKAAGYLLVPSGDEYAIAVEEHFEAVFIQSDTVNQLKVGRIVFRTAISRASFLHLVLYSPDSSFTYEAIKPIPQQPGQCAADPPVCAPFLSSSGTLRLRTDGKYGYAKRFNLQEELPVPPYIQKKTSYNMGKAVAFRTIKNFSEVEHEPNLLYNYTGARRKESGSWFLTLENALKPELDSTLQYKTLAYLLTPKEQRRAKKSEAKTAHVEEFWQNSAKKSSYQSETLSKEYYKRARYANLHFTTRKAGWLTDRGVIYILFGPPDELTIAPEGEYWQYASAPGYEAPLAFEFLTDERRFGDLLVVRNLSYQPFWFAAIAQWRNGNIAIYE